LLEIMRGTGIRLNKCQFRGDIKSAIDLLKSNRLAIKVFMVDYETLAKYAHEQNEDLSCFVRQVRRILDVSNSN